MKGRATKEGRYVALFFVAFFAVFYLHSSYSSIFETKPALLYDADSGDLYLMQMAPYLADSRKWEAFNPFGSLKYVYPTYEERLGNLRELLKEQEELSRVRSQDQATWQDSNMEALNKALKSVDSAIIEAWRIEVFHKPLTLNQGGIPAILRNHVSDDKNLSSISPVEAIAVRSISDLDRPGLPDKMDLYKIPNGFLIEGSAASAIGAAINY
tara:strand:- start:212 stop:847 length:636 start_codon:yes stop_codon:yes gene_type:complete